jgi:hypothetical protein
MGDMPHKRLAGWEWLALVGLLLLVAVLGQVRFELAPPGVIHDEVRNWLNARLVMAGEVRALYPYGGGREALYVLVEAGSYALLGNNLLAARLPSLAFAMLDVAVLYAFTRRLFSPVAAVFAAAGMATSFWLLMFARLAVRVGAMPTLGLLAAYLYWRAVEGRAGRAAWPGFVAGGLALAATLYTYPSGLMLLAVLLGWVVVVALGWRGALRGKWIPLAASFGLAALLAIPLAREWADPQTAVRAAEVDAPLEALFAGDPSRVAGNIGPVLGVFSVGGDHGLEFNLQDRPIFPEPNLAVLFYLGMIVALRGLFGPPRRRAASILCLLWLIGMLAPTLVTERPVNPYRTIGLLAVVYIFPAIVAGGLADLGRRQGTAGTQAFIGVLGGLILALNLGLTIRDYFVDWASNPVVRFLYQDTYRVIADDLGAEGNIPPTSLGGLTPDVMDPASMRLLLRNDALAGKISYFDPQSALIVPGGERVHVIVPGFVTLHPALDERLAAWADPPRPDQPAAPYDLYTLYVVTRQPTPVLHFADGASSFASPGSEPVVTLLGMELAGEVAPGQPMVLLSYWRAERPSSTPLKVFVHLINANGDILSQSDILGAGATDWAGGDLIVQVHELNSPPDQPGELWLRVGLYDSQSGARLVTPGGEFVLFPFEVPGADPPS